MIEKERESKRPKETIAENENSMEEEKEGRETCERGGDIMQQGKRRDREGKQGLKREA